MNAIKIPVFTLFFLAVAGCQLAPPLTTTQTSDCPIIEAVPCPVCKITQCPKLEVDDKVIPVCKNDPPAVCENFQEASKYAIIGETEWALVEAGDLILETRIDTGAETSSIHAEDIQLVEKDSKRWVRFNLSHPETGAKVPIERRLHRRILVKQKGDRANDRRYVVRMWITLGDKRIWLDVSLSDRDDFEFPLLIGRNMLMDNFVVDVSKHHTLSKPTHLNAVR